MYPLCSTTSTCRSSWHSLTGTSCLVWASYRSERVHRIWTLALALLVPWGCALCSDHIGLYYSLQTFIISQWGITEYQIRICVNQCYVVGAFLIKWTYSLTEQLSQEPGTRWYTVFSMSSYGGWRDRPACIEATLVSNLKRHLCKIACKMLGYSHIVW